jgi:DNA-binding NarL/FixJ family response regulator
LRNQDFLSVEDIGNVFARADFLYCDALIHWGRVMLDVIRVPALLVEEDAADRARFSETLGGGALDVCSAATRRDGTATVLDHEFGLYVFGLGTGCSPRDLEMVAAARARHSEPPVMLLFREAPSLEVQERALELDSSWMAYSVTADTLRLHIERTFQRRDQRARSIAGAIRSRSGLTPSEEQHLFHVLCGRNRATIASKQRVSPKTVSVHRARALAKAGRANIDGWILASSRAVWAEEDTPEAEPAERISCVRIRPVDARDEQDTPDTPRR